MYGIPEKINVRKVVESPWEHPPYDSKLIKQWEKSFISAGYVFVGLYFVEEMKGFLYYVYVNEDQTIVATIHAAKSGHSAIEISAEYTNGINVNVITTKAYSFTIQPDGYITIRCLERNPTKLIALMQSEIANKGLLKVDVLKYEKTIEDGYVKEMKAMIEKQQEVSEENIESTNEIERTTRTLPAIDFVELEALLLDLIVNQIVTFSREHNKKIFYAIGLDCNAFYGDVLLCANTENYLSKTFKQYEARHKDDASIVNNENILEDFRSGYGDWKYQGFNLNGSWAKRWEALSTKVNLAAEEDETIVERFMEMICRIVIKLETHSSIELINKTSNFVITCVDHDESIEDGNKRLARERDIDS